LVIWPPKVEATEVMILSPEQIVDVRVRLEDYPLHPIVTLAFGTGMRRAKLCAPVWGTVDLDRGSVSVERSLEETGGAR